MEALPSPSRGWPHPFPVPMVRRLITAIRPLAASETAAGSRSLLSHVDYAGDKFDRLGRPSVASRPTGPISCIIMACLGGDVLWNPPRKRVSVGSSPLKGIRAMRFL